MKNTYYGEIVRGNVGPVFKIYNGTFQKLGNFEADAYPMGTRVTITLEEPEPPKERIVLPEGMRWDDAGLLWTADGNLVASARSGTSWFRQPFMLAHFNIPSLESIEATKQTIESALAEHGYFGVRKVVKND